MEWGVGVEDKEMGVNSESEDRVNSLKRKIINSK